MANEPFITTTHGLSGYFAVLMTWNEEFNFYEPFNTGFGRYDTQEEAVREAKSWALADEIPYQ